MLKKLIYLLLCLIGLLMLLVSCFLALNTEAGSRFTLQFISKISKGAFQYESSKGNLTHLNLQNVRYQNKYMICNLEQLQIDWQPIDFLSKYKLHISSLQIKNSKIYILARKNIPQENHFTFNTLQQPWYEKLPLPIQVDDLEIVNSKLQIPQISESTTIDQITLKIDTNYSNAVTIQGKFKAVFGSGSIEGQISPDYHLLWRVDLTDLKRILPNAHGDLHAQGLVQGGITSPQIATQLNANQLYYANYKLEKLAVNFNINPKIIRESYLTFLAQKIAIGAYSIDKIAIRSEWQKTVPESDLLKITFAPSNVTLPFTDQLQILATQESDIQIAFHKDNIKIQGTLNFEKQNPLLATFTIPRQKNASLIQKNQNIQGNLKWNSTNLSFLSLLSPALKNTQGVLNLSYVFSGTMQKPLTNGNVNLTNFSCDIPDLKLHFFNSSFKAVSDHNNIDYNATLQSGPGYLKITGKTILNDNDYATKLDVSGKNFLISNLGVATIIASPQLQIKSIPQGFKITGTVFTPKALIQPANYNETITLPQETQIQSTQSSQEQAPLQLAFYSQLQLILGDDVKLDASGLSGNLTGSLQLNDTPSATTVTGDLDIKNGIYKLYGQNLRVSSGKLIYLNNPFNQPTINITALRNFQTANTADSWQANSETPSDLIVGIRMQGRLDNLKTSLFSYPSTLTDADILSYLVIGESTNQASSPKLSLLFKAANVLNLPGSSQFGQITSQIQRKLGLSKLGLEEQTTMDTHTSSDDRAPINLLPNTTTSSSGNVATSTALVLGKYLAPKLYLGYSFRIINQVNVFNINYILSKFWIIQSEASTLGSGVDLLFRFEK